MSQIWLGLIWIISRDQVFEQNKKKHKKNKVLGDLLWDGGRGEGSPMHCFFFCFFWCLFFWVGQIADRLTLQ